MNPMTNQDECKFLRKLQGDINVFGPDQFNLIKRYFLKTGMKTNILNTLAGLRETLKKNEDEPLEKKYNDIREAFNKYIDQRLSFLQDPSKAHHLDPWMEMSFSAKDEALREQLRQMSHHLQDALFNCEMVIDYELKEGLGNAKEDLEQFKKVLLQSGKAMQKLENLPSEIDALEQAMEEQKFDQAEKIVKQIKSECKARALALKIIPK